MGSFSRSRNHRAASARHRWFFRLLLVGFSLLIGAGLMEITLRLFFAERLDIVKDERYLLYRYHETLGWFPIPNVSKNVKASRMFKVVHNRRGFRDAPRYTSDKPGIIFLGDSYVWGYDVDLL